MVVVEEEGNKKGAYVKKTSLRMTSFKFLRGLRRPVPIVTRRDTYAGGRGYVDLARIYENVYFVKTALKLYELYSNMPNLRGVRDCLLLGLEENILTYEEFILLYDMNTSKNPDFPYWQNESFDLDDLCDDECKAEFRFMKNDIYQVKDFLQMPDEIV